MMWKYLCYITLLLSEGARLQVYDPEGAKNFIQEMEKRVPV